MPKTAKRKRREKAIETKTDLALERVGTFRYDDFAVAALVREGLMAGKETKNVYAKIRIRRKGHKRHNRGEYFELQLWKYE